MYTETMNINLPEIEKFPVTPYLQEISKKLKREKSRAIVLTAETGAGKSTILPVGLLQNFSGKILMTEPRRLAVLGVASRISDLINEECGRTVGYKIHLESCISADTRLEILTEGVLVRMLQENPALEGYEVVVLDEAHERSVNLDLALAFFKEAMELRDDLYVVVMSATINAKKIADFLGTETVFSIPGRTYPVEVEYDQKSTVEQAIVKELEGNRNGNVLVFLPGISDILKTKEKLSGYIENNSRYEICVLHSSISLEEQRKILKPSVENKQRIILSSAIAETSLTVPDVTTVIDSGFARVARIEISTGMQKLVTERESEFSAEQRKGRAGRVQKGRCIRLWSQHDVRIKELVPEILRCELSELVLECADRGIIDLEKMNWLDKPNAAEWKESVFLLQQLGFLNQEGKISAKGRVSLKLGLSPRLADVVLEDCLIKKGQDNDGEIPKLSKAAIQLLIDYGNYKKSPPPMQKQYINDIESRLQKIQFNQLFAEVKTQNEFAGQNIKAYLILAGFPDRLAKKVSDNNSEKTEYQFPNGRKAVPGNSSGGVKAEWIVAPEVMSGQKDAVIFEYECIPEEFVNKWLKNRLKTEIVCEFSGGKVRKTENLCFGRIIISSKNQNTDAKDYAKAWCMEVRKSGLKCLPQNKAIESFLQRAAFSFQQKQNTTGKDGLEIFLIEKVEEWLVPFITGVILTEQNVYDGLYWFLNGAQIDSEIPEILILPNGNKAKVKYEWLASPDDKNKMVLRPVIEIIIQRVFGCFETPEISGMKVLLRLLSPASRPLQITDDLKNFWITTWPDICKEMKGRYPKHNWDYSIVEKDR